MGELGAKRPGSCCVGLSLGSRRFPRSSCLLMAVVSGKAVAGGGRAAPKTLLAQHCALVNFNFHTVEKLTVQATWGINAQRSSRPHLETRARLLGASRCRSGASPQSAAPSRTAQGGKAGSVLAVPSPGRSQLPPCSAPQSPPGGHACLPEYVRHTLLSSSFAPAWEGGASAPATGLDWAAGEHPLGASSRGVRSGLPTGGSRLAGQTALGIQRGGRSGTGLGGGGLGGVPRGGGGLRAET